MFSGKRYWNLNLNFSTICAWYIMGSLLSTIRWAPDDVPVLMVVVSNLSGPIDSEWSHYWVQELYCPASLSQCHVVAPGIIEHNSFFPQIFHEVCMAPPVSSFINCIPFSHLLLSYSCNHILAFVLTNNLLCPSHKILFLGLGTPEQTLLLWKTFPDIPTYSCYVG